MVSAIFCINCIEEREEKHSFLSKNRFFDIFFEILLTLALDFGNILSVLEKTGV